MMDGQCPRHGTHLAERLNKTRTKIVRYCLHCEAEREFASYANSGDQYEKAELRYRAIEGAIGAFILSFVWIGIIVAAICESGSVCAQPDVLPLTLILSAFVAVVWVSYSIDSYKPKKLSLTSFIAAQERKAEEYRKEVDRFLQEHRWRWKKITSGIHDADQMSGRQFELFMRDVFERMGYAVRVTKKTGDQGADLILTKDSKRTAVQCKRYSQRARVGVSAVQEVFAAKAIYGCESAMIVTTSYFTEPSIRMAEQLGVILWDRDQLINELAKVQQKISWDEYKAALYE